MPRLLRLVLATLAALVVALAGGAAVAAAACDTTYTGADGGQWDTDANWTLATSPTTHHKPTSTEAACIPAGKSVLIVEASGITAQSLDIASGATLTMRTDPGYGSTQAFFGDVTNAGDITFASSGPASNAEGGDENYLWIGDGKTLTNTGTITVAQDEGIAYIGGNVDNQAGGEIEVDSWLRLNGTAGQPAVLWKNAGSITVGASGHFRPNSGSGVELRQTAGSFVSSGDVLFQTSTDQLTVTGGSFGGIAPTTVPVMRAGKVSVTGGSGTVRVQFGAISLVGDVGTGWTVRAEDRSSFISQVNVPVDVTNRGTIVLAKEPSAETTNRTGTGVFVGDAKTLTNLGTIRVDSDIADEGYLSGDIDNQAGGVIDVRHRTRINGAPGGAPTLWRNAGTVSITATGDLYTNAGAGVEYRQTAGTLSSAGAFTFLSSSDQLSVSGGSFGGTVPTAVPVMRAGKVSVTGGSGTVRVQFGAISLVGDVGAGWTVRAEDRSSFISQINVPVDVTNRGTIVLAKEPSADATNRTGTGVFVGDAKTLTNLGTIRVDSDIADEGYLSGDIDNQAGGVIDVRHRTRINGAPGGAPTLWRNAGTVSITATGDLYTNAGAGVEYRQTAGSLTSAGAFTFLSSSDKLSVSGGSFGGTTLATTPAVQQGTLNLTGGTGTVRIHWGFAVLGADIPASWTVRIEDRSSGVVSLRIPGGTTRTNRGTVRFAHDPDPATTNRTATQILIQDGGRFINDGTITVDADLDPVQMPSIDATLTPPGKAYRDPDAFVQHGTLTVNHDVTTPPFTATGGTTTVASGKRMVVGNTTLPTDPGLTIGAGATLSGSGTIETRGVTNGGTVAPTPGQGTALSITSPSTTLGTYTQLAGGTLQSRLSGSGTPLVVSGAVRLDGTLDVASAPSYTPAAGATFPVVSVGPLVPGQPFGRRAGRFTAVTGALAPVYEDDGVDVTAASPAGTPGFSVDDVSAPENLQLTFTIRRSGTPTGSATVHWTAQATGSADPIAYDYSIGQYGYPVQGDVTFGPGETTKQVSTFHNYYGNFPDDVFWIAGGGGYEPDETFRIHLSHATGSPIADPDGTVTILNTDSDLTAVSPNVLPGTGPTAVQLYGAGLSSSAQVTLRHSGRPNIPALSYEPAADGNTAMVTFDTSTATPRDDQWFVQVDNGATHPTRPVTITASSVAAQPYVQAFGAANARGGIPTDHIIGYGNTGGTPSSNALIRLGGFPTGADITVDHLPPGAYAQQVDGVAGRTIVVAVGRIPSHSDQYLRVRYTPTTTIAGHTELRLQVAMTFSAAAPPALTGQTATTATDAAPGAGLLFDSTLGFSGGGQARVTYGETGGTDTDPVITHGASAWTFKGTYGTVDKSPRIKVNGVEVKDYSQGLLTVDFNGGEFKISGPLQEIEGAYELSIDRKRLTECMWRKGWLTQEQRDQLTDLAEGAVVLKGLVTAGGVSSTVTKFAPQLGALDGVMSGAWEKAVAGSALGPGALDVLSDPNSPFLGIRDNEEQLLLLMQYCRDKPAPEEQAPDPEYDDHGNYKPSPYIQHLLQSGDPNEKSGTQGGGAQHAVRSDKPLDYRVDFENKPTASAPAQTIVIKDHVDPAKVDLTTFALGPIGFGDTLLTPPAHVSSWTTTADLRPAQDVIAKVEAALNASTGLVTWTFTALDPATMAATTDPLAGVLPPNQVAPEGQGYVSYSARPKSGVASGTTIASAVPGVASGSARITFDANAPIDTNAFSNVIDDDAPSSAVTSVDNATCGKLAVRWSGSDPTSGVASYDVYVSKDGGDFALLRAATTDTSLDVVGDAGHAYAFDVQARDLAGNLQSADRSDARSATVADCPPPAVGGPAGSGQSAPGAGGGTPQAAPVAKPWVRLGKLPAKLAGRALVVPVSCPATEATGCSGKLAVTITTGKGKRSKTITLGSSAFKVAAGKTLRVKVKFSVSAAARLKKAALKVTVTATPAAKADARRTTASGTLRRVKR